MDAFPFRSPSAARTHPIRPWAAIGLVLLLLGGFFAPGLHLALEEHAIGADGRLVHVGCGSNCGPVADSGDPTEGPGYGLEPSAHAHLCLVLELAKERATHSERAVEAHGRRLEPAPAEPWPAEVLGESIARHRLAPKQSPPAKA